ncbi:MAG: Nif3-like dinuclear metal center hexameric protein [Clostridiales bacterium]|jgi:dinuclear metal center YbgI/SA1388 family protein|nr:Nif3-like dinuclear metal center hexameric protein [Clostridiales bacterium]
MTVTAGDIANKLEAFAPAALAEKWDNVGLLVGGFGAAVRRVLIALDADGAAVAEAEQTGADLLIVHHPIMHSPINRITDATPEGRLILRLIQSNIALFAAHTNLDSADGGVNDALARALGLTDIQPLRTDGFDGSARMGNVTPRALEEFSRFVGDALGSAVIKRTGNPSGTVRKVGVCGGAGAFMLTGAQKSGCDVLVTGEGKYHDAQLASELGIGLIEAGHYETEAVVCKPLRDYLTQSFDGIEIMESKRNHTYYSGFSPPYAG